MIASPIASAPYPRRHPLYGGGALQYFQYRYSRPLPSRLSPAGLSMTLTPTLEVCGEKRSQFLRRSSIGLACGVVVKPVVPITILYHAGGKTPDASTPPDGKSMKTSKIIFTARLLLNGSRRTLPPPPSPACPARKSSLQRGTQAEHLPRHGGPINCRPVANTGAGRQWRRDLCFMHSYLCKIGKTVSEATSARPRPSKIADN